MDTKQAALNVAGVVFFLMALLHLVRLIFHFEVAIAGVQVPLWASLPAGIVLFLLSLWMFKSIR